MATKRVTQTNSSPSTEFYVEGDLLSQSTAGNYSLVRCYLVAVNRGNTSSYMGGAGVQAGTIVGVKEFARRTATSNFLPSGYSTGATRWRMGPYDVQVPHNSDGTRAPIRFGMVLDYSSFNQTVFSGDMALPAIPRTSIPTLSSASVDVGTTLTITTNRASTAFTHTLELWEYGGELIETLATAVGDSYAWAVPVTRAKDFPSAESKKYFIRVVTMSGAATIGRYDAVFDLTAPASMKPTVGSVTYAEQNAAVTALMGAGKPIQNASIVRFTVNAAGVQDSTITSRTVAFQGATASAGSDVPLTGSGTNAFVGNATDSRGRVGTKSTNMSIIAYTPPEVTYYKVSRADSAGNSSETGTYLRLEVAGNVKTIKDGTTEKNGMTIRVYTKATSQTWAQAVLRNTVNPTGLSIPTTAYLVTGGGIFAQTSSYNVRVQIIDKLGNAATADTTIATSKVTLDLSGTNVGIGKMWQTGVLDVGGDVNINGGLAISGTMTAGTVPFARIPDAPIGKVNTVNSTAGPSDFIEGITYSQAGTGFPASLGLVETVRHSDYRAVQYFWDRQTNTRAYFRAGNGSTAWQAWREVRTDASPEIPFAMAGGKVDAPASGYTSVTFPTGRFSVPPIVVTNGGSQGVVGVPRAISTTATGFQLGVWNLAGAQIAATDIHWTAIQMTSSAAAG